MIQRDSFINTIKRHFNVHQACAILGPRQCGKTTLSKAFAASYPDHVHSFDLENPRDLARLENPLLAFEDLKGLIIIDEIQRRPDLFPILRVLIDKTDLKFLILGSASRDLISQSSETLAGRIGYIELTPFQLHEIDNEQRLWLRGGFPKSYLAPDDGESFLWMHSYISTFLERDIPSLGFSVAPQHIRRFWMMIAHYHGSIFNASEIGRSLGLSDHTAKKYLDILAGTFMIRPLYPWFENISKRQVKAPKVYFRDSGIFHALLNFHREEEIYTHPKLGASWEGFALEQIIQTLGLSLGDCFFWRTHSGAELDLLIFKEGRRIGFEFKYTDAPKVTSSMRIAYADLKLDRLFLVYPGKERFLLGNNIIALGLSQAIKEHL